MNNFQRVGSTSNSNVGNDFEKLAQAYYQSCGLNLKRNYKLEIGISSQKKAHAFDLGSDKEKILVECKSHKWTSGNNIPSAKLTVWNEAMFYFYLAPSYYKKIFFVLRDYSVKRQESLAEYYVRTYRHLIPEDVEIIEYDKDTQNIKTIIK